MEIKKYEWKELSKNFENVNPELAEIINQISPDSSYSLYDISYEYGENIGPVSSSPFSKEKIVEH